MVALQKLVVSTALVSVALGDEAPANFDSHKRTVARAHLDNGLVKGLIEFTSTEDGVNVHLDVTGLPEGLGPFNYRIHDYKVKGHCERAGDVFNPFDANYVECDDLGDDSLCSVGDLSGKHGVINTTCFEIEYQDPYLSLNKRNLAYIKGKSIVITDFENNIISCGDIKLKRGKKLKRDLNNPNQSIQQDHDEFFPNLIPQAQVQNVSNNSTTFYSIEEEQDENDPSGVDDNLKDKDKEVTFDSGANKLGITKSIGLLALAGLMALI